MSIIPFLFSTYGFCSHKKAYQSAVQDLYNQGYRIQCSCVVVLIQKLLQYNLALMLINEMFFVFTLFTTFQ